MLITLLLATVLGASAADADHGRSAEARAAHPPASASDRHEADAPELPAYVKDLVAVMDAWRTCDASADPDIKKGKPTVAALNAAREAAWTAFVRKANWRPVTLEDYNRVHGTALTKIDAGGEVDILNAWMLKAPKSKSYGECTDGFVISLYGLYKNQPWAQYLNPDWSPVEEKRLVDDVVTRLAKAEADNRERAGR